MKPATVVLSLILILMLAFGAFFYTGGTLQAQATSITAGAAEHPDAFNSIKTVLSSGSAPQLFSTDALDDAAKAAFANEDPQFLADLFIVSKLTLGEADEGTAGENCPNVKVSVAPAAGDKCPRCWKNTEAPNANGLCPRCAAVLGE